MNGPFAGFVNSRPFAGDRVLFVASPPVIGLEGALPPSRSSALVAPSAVLCSCCHPTLHPCTSPRVSMPDSLAGGSGGRGASGQQASQMSSCCLVAQTASRGSHSMQRCRNCEDLHGMRFYRNQPRPSSLQYLYCATSVCVADGGIFADWGGALWCTFLMEGASMVFWRCASWMRGVPFIYRRCSSLLLHQAPFRRVGPPT